MGLFAVSLLLALAQAPETPPPAAPAEATRTVDLWITGEKGEPVEGLGADEVVVMEDGAARVVTRVVRDTRPLTVAILVDSSAPQSSTYRLHLVDAVTGFVRKLPEHARYEVWVTGDRPRKVVEATDDRGRAAPALRKVFPTGGNVVLDALVEVAEELEEREAERAMIVVVTGVGIGFSSHGRQHVVDLVRRRRIPVMAVQFEERGSAEFGAGPDQVSRVDYDYVLSNITRSGVHERPVSAMGVDTALARVAAALRGGYRVTYARPEGAKAEKIEVQVARPGVKVQVGETR